MTTRKCQALQNLLSSAYIPLTDFNLAKLFEFFSFKSVKTSSSDIFHEIIIVFSPPSHQSSLLPPKFNCTFFTFISGYSICAIFRFFLRAMKKI